MSTLITINLQNNSLQDHSFFFFQQPAIYVGGPKVYSNSLYSAPLGPFANGGGQLTFRSNLQFYAGVQQSNNSVPMVGSSSGYGTASRPIDLAPADDRLQTSDGTNMTITPSSGLGLSVPQYMDGVQPGAFRIVTPTYNPNVDNYFAGSAVTLDNGSVVLSNFVLAGPLENIDAQPILQYYVAVGDYTAGTVMNFTDSSVTAALCDATQGVCNFNVLYNANGTWTVN